MTLSNGRNVSRIVPVVDQTNVNQSPWAWVGSLSETFSLLTVLHLGPCVVPWREKKRQTGDRTRDSLYFVRVRRHYAIQPLNGGIINSNILLLWAAPVSPRPDFPNTSESSICGIRYKHLDYMTSEESPLDTRTMAWVMWDGARSL